MNIVCRSSNSINNDLTHLNIIRTKVRRGNPEGALHNVHYIKRAPAADEALTLIGKKALLEGNIPLAEQVAKRMNRAFSADSLFKECVNAYLKKGLTEAALRPAGQIHWAPSQDKALNRIARQALTEGNISLAERAAKKMNWASSADALFKECVKAYLSKKGCTEKALAPARQIHWASSQDEALSLIGRKAIEEGNIPVATRAAKRMNLASNANALWEKIHCARN